MRWKPLIIIDRWRMNGEVKAYDTSVGRVNKLSCGAAGCRSKKIKNAVACRPAPLMPKTSHVIRGEDERRRATGSVVKVGQGTEAGSPCRTASSP